MFPKRLQHVNTVRTALAEQNVLRRACDRHGASIIGGVQSRAQPVDRMRQQAQTLGTDAANERAARPRRRRRRGHYIH